MSEPTAVSSTNPTGSDERLVTAVRIGMIDVDGTLLRVGVRPGSAERPPLLLLNGIGANLELLKPFVDALDPEIEAISFDVPGVGGSPPPTIPFRFSGLAQLIDNLLDHLHYHEADVMGVSWGGALAQEFAYKYPHRCRRLILAATAPGQIMVPGKLSVMLNMASPRRYLQPAHMVKIAPKIYGGKLRDDPRRAAKHAEEVMSGGGVGYLFQMFAMMGWTSIHWLHKIKQPTLILAGKDDPIVPPINAKIMLRRIPNARLQMLDCGHLFIITLADEVGGHVYRFLHEDK
jgi:poly(3-hydroxyalkanoate) depolymerase